MSRLKLIYPRALLQSWLVGLVERQWVARSWVALRARRHQAAAYIAVGTGATIAALLVFMLSVLGPLEASSRHDALLRARLASPAPAPSIVIVDVDERSLALLAPAHGRWPWPREVLADGVQRLADLGARAVLFNVLVSDHDARNPDGDAALEAATQLFRPMAFPLVRLNPVNDGRSALAVADLPGAVVRPARPGPALGAATVAAILPFLPSMHDRLGVANQRPDGDGIVRTYPLRWVEPRWAMPSLVATTAEQAGVPLAALPDRFSLNWRNKAGRYTRIAFADLLRLPIDDAGLVPLHGAIVVLGVSAPGLGQTRATAVEPVEDDNEILATALDDTLHDTYLRVLPGWATLLFSVATIWLMVGLFLRRVPAGRINTAFVLMQSSLGGITLLSVSYTVWLVDLTEAMSFLLGVFTAIKLVQLLGDRWARATPGYRRVGVTDGDGVMAIAGYLQKNVTAATRQRWQQALEKLLGFTRVVRVDGLFGGDSFLQRPFADYECLVLLLKPGEVDAVQAMFEADGEKDLVLTEASLDRPWNPEDAGFAAWVAPWLLENCALVVSSGGTPAPAASE